MECSKCKGRGVIHNIEQDLWYNCKNCNGEGFVADKTAKEMFEELGYILTRFESNNFCRWQYDKKTILENSDIRRQVIWFDFNTKELYIHNSITLEELKAINKQIEELRWEVVDENN